MSVIQIGSAVPLEDINPRSEAFDFKTELPTTDYILRLDGIISCNGIEYREVDNYKKYVGNSVVGAYEAGTLGQHPRFIAVKRPRNNTRNVIDTPVQNDVKVIEYFQTMTIPKGLVVEARLLKRHGGGKRNSEGVEIEHDDTVGIVMEKCQGSMESWIQYPSPIRLTIILRFLKTITGDILQMYTITRLLHADIKLANFLFTRDQNMGYFLIGDLAGFSPVPSDIQMVSTYRRFGTIQNSIAHAAFQIGFMLYQLITRNKCPRVMLTRGVNIHALWAQRKGGVAQVFKAALNEYNITPGESEKMMTMAERLLLFHSENGEAELKRILQI